MGGGELLLHDTREDQRQANPARRGVHWERGPLARSGRDGRVPRMSFPGNMGLWPTKALGGDHRPCGRGCLQPSLPFIADDAGHCFDPLGVIVEAGAVLEVFAAGVGKDFAAFVTDLVERFQAIRREAR